MKGIGHTMATTMRQKQILGKFQGRQAQNPKQNNKSWAKEEYDQMMSQLKNEQIETPGQRSPPKNDDVDYEKDEFQENKQEDRKNATEKEILKPPKDIEKKIRQIKKKYNIKQTPERKKLSFVEPEQSPYINDPSFADGPSMFQMESHDDSSSIQDNIAEPENNIISEHIVSEYEDSPKKCLDLSVQNLPRSQSSLSHFHKEYKPLNLQSMKMLKHDSSLHLKKLERDLSSLHGNTFRPCINSRSSKLAQTSRKSGTKAWDNLYNYDKIRKEENEKKRAEIKQKQEAEKMSECTFEPKITTRRREKSFGAKSNSSQYERNLYWLQEKQKKIKKLQKKEIQNEIKGVSFKPDLKKTENYDNGKIQTKQMKGVQQHMQRILDAKKKKIQELEVFLLPSQKQKLNESRAQQYELQPELMPKPMNDGYLF